jgi:surfeit locus 1 family protein
MTPATTRPPSRARSSRIARVVVTLATIASIALFVAAGNWQRERMHAKEADRAQSDRMAALPPVALPRTDEWESWRHRRVLASGSWRGGAQLLVDNRVHAGRAGFAVVTPLALDDGRIVLVDRGWIAAGAGSTRVPDVAAPSGRAIVQGRVALPRARYVELETAGPSGNVWQNLDPRRIAATTGLALLPIVVEQDPAAPADGLVRHWPAPDAGVDTHRIYMWQWYTFAALAAAAWIGFALRRWRGTA